MDTTKPVVIATRLRGSQGIGGIVGTSPAHLEVSRNARPRALAQKTGIVSMFQEKGATEVRHFDLNWFHLSATPAQLLGAAEIAAVAQLALTREHLERLKLRAES